MKTSLMALCLATIFGGGFDTICAASQESLSVNPPRILTILVFDYSGWGDGAIHESETITSLLLSRAEIRTRWLHCLGNLADMPRPELCGGGDLTSGTVLLRIVPAYLGQPSKVGHPLGEAVIEVGYASIFASEVGKQAGHYDVTPATLMGYAMAHEIGHLLFGEKHAASGLMRAVWG